MRKVVSCFRGSVPGVRSLSVGAPLSQPQPQPQPQSISGPNKDQILEALHAGKLGFGFSGGGFLLPYFVGVVRALDGLGLLQPTNIHIAGSSAGSLIAASVMSGLTTDQILDSFNETAHDCRRHGVPKRLGPLLKQQLEKNLPADAHELCSGRAHVGVTHLFPYPSSKVVSHFHDRNDLIETLLVSCHIPWLTDGSITTEHRSKRAIDGGFTCILPTPPNLSDQGVTVKISCIPHRYFPHIPAIMRPKQARVDLAISPDMFHPWPYPLDETIRLSLQPGDEAFFDLLLSCGQRDVAAWAAGLGLTQVAGMPTSSHHRVPNAAHSADRPRFAIHQATHPGSTMSMEDRAVMRSSRGFASASAAVC